MSRDSVVEVDRTPTVDHGYPDAWDGLEHHEAYEGGLPDWPDDFYGFGKVELAIDHGARVTGHHLHWALDKGARYEDLVVPMSEDSPHRRRSDRWWQVFEPPYEEEIHSTSFVTERTIAFIEDAAANEENWYAWASFPDPHHPFSPPGQWFDRHRADDMIVPASVDDALEHAPAYLRHMQSLTADRQRTWVSPIGASDRDLLRECIAATYGMVEFIDDGVGRIMAAIDRLGQLDNTIVVFTADHGDMMGDHGLMMKGFMPFSGTLRVPFVIADPRREAARTTSLASSIDLGPTLMDLCDVAVHDGVQGRALTPVLDDPAEQVHDYVLAEDDLRSETAVRARIPSRIRTVVAADGTKYTRFNTGESMLFDLTSDPDEMGEIGHLDAAKRSKAESLLVDALLATSDDARGAPVSSVVN